MSTVVGSIVGEYLVIGSDTLLMQGDTRLSMDYGHNPKIFVVGNSCIGLTGSASHYMPIISALQDMGQDCDLWGSKNIFATFSKLHKVLKDDFYLNPKKQHDDAYESNHISALVANGSGLYGVYAHREVLNFNPFWANGSGRAYALGAMHSLLRSKDGHCVDAKELTKSGLSAAIEFDRSTGGNMIMYQFELSKNCPPLAVDS